MKYNHQLNKFGRIAADGLLLLFLWGILVLPVIGSVSLIRFGRTENNVLSIQDTRNQDFKEEEDLTKTVRETQPMAPHPMAPMEVLNLKEEDTTPANTMFVDN